MLKKRSMLVGVIILGLLVTVLLVSLLLLNSDWLRQKLVENVRASLNADLSVKSLDFAVFKGKASLSGLSFSRKEETSDLDIILESAEMDVNFLPLLYRSVQIRRLELVRPQIISVVRRLPKKDKRSPDQRKPSGKKMELAISELLIRDGVIDFTATREGHEPFNGRITDIQYSAKNVSLNSLLNALYGSDLHCKVEMGANALLEKSGTSDPATFSLKGLDLPYVSKFFEGEQLYKESFEREETKKSGFWGNVRTKIDNFLDKSSDPLIITGGTMDTSYAVGGGTTHVNVAIQGLKLAAHPDVVGQQFMFIPVERIIEYVEENDGNITLEFALDEDVSMSDDLEFIIHEFWEGLWIAILKEISPESVGELVEEGTKKIRDYLQQEEGKQKILDFLRRKKEKEEQ